MEGVHGSDCAPADFSAEIPASEALVFLPVHLPDFVNDELVVLYLVAHVLRVPVNSRVIEAQVEFHSVFLRQAAEHVDEIDGRHVAAFLQKIRRRVGYEFPVAAAYVDDCVYADGLHICEVPVPFLLAPVLVRDVVGYLVEEGSGDSEAVVLRDNEGGPGWFGCISAIS